MGDYLEKFKAKENDIVERTKKLCNYTIQEEARRLKEHICNSITLSAANGSMSIEKYNRAMEEASDLAMYEAESNILHGMPKWAVGEYSAQYSDLKERFSAHNHAITDAVKVPKLGQPVRLRGTGMPVCPTNLPNNVYTVDGSYHDFDLNIVIRMMDYEYYVESKNPANDSREAAINAALETYRYLVKSGSPLAFAFDMVWFRLKEKGVKIDSLQFDISTEEYEECICTLNYMPIMKSYMYTCASTIELTIGRGVTECHNLIDLPTPNSKSTPDSITPELLKHYLDERICDMITAGQLDDALGATPIIIAECLCEVMEIISPNDAACFNPLLGKILDRDYPIGIVDALRSVGHIQYSIDEMKEIFEEISYYSNSLKFEDAVMHLMHEYNELGEMVRASCNKAAAAKLTKIAIPLS